MNPQPQLVVLAVEAEDEDAAGVGVEVEELLESLELELGLEDETLACAGSLAEDPPRLSVR